MAKNNENAAQGNQENALPEDAERTNTREAPPAEVRNPESEVGTENLAETPEEIELREPFLPQDVTIVDNGDGSYSVQKPDNA